MGEQLRWKRVITWSNPITIVDLNVDRSVIPEASGFYAFTPDPGPLKLRKVLYVGETKNLRSRLPKYLVHDPKKIQSNHKGAFLIAGHRAHESNDKSIYVRWSLFDGPKPLFRDIEAAMIQFYDPRYNIRDWDRDHPLED